MTKHEFGKRVYLEVILNGEKVNKWLNLVKINEYDSNGNLIHAQEEYIERWMEYDSHADGIIRGKDSDDNEMTWEREYDEKGRLIHFERYKNGCFDLERWFEYDSSGNCIHNTDSNDEEYWATYNADGKKIHEKYSDGRETWRDYDSKGNLIHIKRDDDYEEFMEHDSEGHVVHVKNSYDEEQFSEYDEIGKLVHRKKFDGTDFWYIREFYENKKTKICYTYRAI